MRQNHRMKSLFTIIFLLISTFVFSQDNWKLIYENDAEGNTINGELGEQVTKKQKQQLNAGAT